VKVFRNLVLCLRHDKSMNAPDLAFEAWKSRLQQDCQLRDKMLAYNTLGEDCLRLLWETGIEPSVQGIIDGSAKAA
jgi:hypothetical protein